MTRPEYNPGMTRTLEKTVDVATHVELERTSEVRHEYVDGQLLAIAGESIRHNDIVANIIETLRPVARASGCQLQFETVRLRVADTRYRYPDVMVSCAHGGDLYALENPCLIVEVLSESTQAADTGAKLDEYTRLGSLERYVIVEQARRVARVYRRTAAGWLFEALEGEGEIEVPCLGATLTLEQVFAGVTFEAPAAPD